MSARTKEIEEEEKLATKTMSVFYQETVLTPEMKEFIEECIDKKVKKVIGLTPVEILRRKKKVTVQKRYFFDIWIGLLSFITWISIYFTMTSILSLVPGLLLIAGCIATLLLFALTR